MTKPIMERLRTADSTADISVPEPEVEFSTREKLVAALTSRNTARSALQESATLAAKTQLMIEAAGKRLLERQNELKRLRQAQALNLAERIRAGFSTVTNEKTEREEELLGECRELERIIASYKLTADAFGEECAQLRSSAEQADSTVKAVIRQIVIEERTQIGTDLKRVMRQAAALRYQLLALGAVRYNQEPFEFPAGMLDLVNGSLDQFESQRVRQIETGNPKMPHYAVIEEPWNDRVPTWHTFMRELEEDPNVKPRF